MKHEVFESFADAQRIRPEWDRLAEQQGSLFCSFDWCEVWWKHFGRGRKLSIHVFSDEQGLAGVFPVFYETFFLSVLPVRVVRLVGGDHTNAPCSFLVREGTAAACGTALVEALAGDRRWDMMFLGLLPCYQPGAEEFARAVGAGPGIASAKWCPDEGPQIVFTVPESQEEYVEALSPKESSKLRRYVRLLEKQHNARVECAWDKASALEILGRVMQLHGLQWAEMGRLGHYRDWPGIEAFHREIVDRAAAEGRAILLAVQVGDEVLAGQHAVRFGRRVCWINSARSTDPRWSSVSPGVSGFYFLMQRAMEGGAVALDAGCGFFDYKIKLGGRLGSLKVITVVRAGRLRRLRLAVFRFACRMLHKVYYRLWWNAAAVWYRKLRARRGLDWLPAPVGPMWELSVRTRFMGERRHPASAACSGE